MWSLTLRLREAGMATLCFIVATAQPPSRSAAGKGGGGGLNLPGKFMASCDSTSKKDIQGVILLNTLDVFLHRTFVIKQ